jgi:NAD(P)-dependent dehydrogenase (short-subunit alcohol dehydrogenase family)
VRAPEASARGDEVTERAALVTGASSGIGLAIAKALGEDGYGVTVAARRPEKLEAAAEDLRAAGIDVNAAPANVVNEEEIVAMVRSHEERFGRLDVLVNNAGVGIGAPLAETAIKALDMQLSVNVRSYVLTTREALPMLKKAGGEHGKALIANTASIAGKSGQPWISIYSATKFAVVGLTQATQKEVGEDGIQATALCPGLVDTPMTDWARGNVDQEDMIRPEDIAESIRFLLRTSRNCVVPEIVFARPTSPLESATL